MSLLKDRVCIITGGTRGIGRAIAEKFADEGAHIAFVYKKSIKHAKEFCAIMDDKGVQNLAFKGDVTDADFLRNMVAEVKDKWGKIDILVNNAGITKDKPLLFLSESDWDSVINTNLKSNYLLCREVVSTMMNQKYGKIINISSLTALMGREAQTNYGAAKAGVIGFTKSLSRELAGYNILVNAIAAGLVNTRLIKKIPREMLEQVKEYIPLGRVAEPEEIAGAALFLASDLSSYITGTVLNVTGGAYM